MHDLPLTEAGLFGAILLFGILIYFYKIQQKKFNDKNDKH